MHFIPWSTDNFSKCIRRSSVQCINLLQEKKTSKWKKWVTKWMKYTANANIHVARPFCLPWWEQNAAEAAAGVRFIRHTPFSLCLFFLILRLFYFAPLYFCFSCSCLNQLPTFMRLKLFNFCWLKIKDLELYGVFCPYITGRFPSLSCLFHDNNDSCMKNKGRLRRSCILAATLSTRSGLNIHILTQLNVILRINKTCIILRQRNGTKSLE